MTENLLMSVLNLVQILTHVLFESISSLIEQSEKEKHCEKNNNFEFGLHLPLKHTIQIGTQFISHKFNVQIPL